MPIHRLRGLRAYLAGPIECCVGDAATAWRIDITKWLRDKGAVILDPTNKTIYLQEDEIETIALRKKLKREGKFKELRELMRAIRETDLRYVDVADFIVVFLDLNVRMFGTFEEIAIANRQKKPVLVVVHPNKYELNDWAFAQLRPELFFDTFDELKTYLNHVDTADSVEDYGRWRFLNL